MGHIMNILLWVLQISLALHTAAGAIWKFSNSEQTVAALRVIPHGVWLSLGVLELLCTLGLVLPFIKNLGILAPIAAAIIAAEMLFYCGISIFSGPLEYNHLIYWLVVAAVSGFIVFGRSVLKPL